MTDPKCIHAHIDGLASMALPEGHAPEVLCTLTDIGGMVCTGEAGCRFFRAEPDMSALREAVAKAIEGSDPRFSIRLVRLVDDVSTYRLSTDDGEPDAEFDDQDEAYAELGRRKAKSRADAVMSAIRAAGYDIVPRK